MIYLERELPEKPPCEICRIIPFIENEDALNIFFVTQYQFIMGFNGPIDINQLAIHEAMKLYNIKNRKECFEKVMILSRWWIEKIINKE